MENTNLLELTDEQLELVARALENYVRLSIGQFEKLPDMVNSIGNWCRSEKQMEHRKEFFEQALKELHILYTGSPNGGPGIHNTEKVTEDARAAHNIESEIRHFLHKKNGGPKYSVHSYKPLHSTIKIDEK